MSRTHCPNCGADLSPNAVVCHECGADDETGWRDEDAVDLGLGLTDEDFDYEAFIKREFRKEHRSGQKLWVILTALVMLIIFALVFI